MRYENEFRTLKVVILNNRIKQNAELVFSSYSDSFKNVELFLLSNEISECKSQNSDFYVAEPLRDCRRLNILREYDNEKTNLHS